MKAEMTLVAQFHLACDVPTRSTFDGPLIARVEKELRSRLMAEESNEMVKGLRDKDRVEIVDGVVDTMVVTAGSALQLGVNPDQQLAAAADELRGYIMMVFDNALDANDGAAIARSLSMMELLAQGIGQKVNMPYSAAFEEVHDSNMAKVGPDGKVIKDAGGKVQKPEGWTKPDIAKVLTQYDRVLGRVVEDEPSNALWMDTSGVL